MQAIEQARHWLEQLRQLAQFETVVLRTTESTGARRPDEADGQRTAFSRNPERR